MNGDVKVLDQKPASAPVPGSAVAPQGSLNKEKSPIGTNLSEFIKPAGPEISPNPSAEEEKSGVEVKSDRPSLTSEHRELGMDHAGSNITVLTQPSGSIQLPMSDEEIEKLLRTGQDDDSRKGLAKLVDKVGKALGEALGF